MTHYLDNPQDYILERCAPVDGGCWEWAQSLDGHGYAQGYNGVRPEQASRLAYRAFVGPIPDGLCVCHTCDNRKCVNPNHFWLGTRADNLRDMREKGRGYTPPRRGCGPHGNPVPCRPCATARQRLHRARKRVAPTLAVIEEAGAGVMA